MGQALSRFVFNIKHKICTKLVLICQKYYSGTGLRVFEHFGLDLYIKIHQKLFLVDARVFGFDVGTAKFLYC